MIYRIRSIKLNGVIAPSLARHEKDRNGYEIVPGHRRCRGSELAALLDLEEEDISTRAGG